MKEQIFESKLFLLLFLIVSVCSQDLRLSNSSDDLAQVDSIKNFEEVFGRFKNLAKKAVKTLMPFVMDKMAEGNLRISGECQRSLFKAVAAFRELKSWAVYMLDASAKSLDGLFLGSLSSFGNYDECLAIVATEKKRKDGEEKVLFRGQYCTIEGGPAMPPKPKFYKLNQRMDAFKVFENHTGLLGELTSYVQLFYFLNFRFGLCVPSTCQPDDIHQLAIAATEGLAEGWVSKPRCEVKEDSKIEPYQIPAICAFVVLLLVAACGTLMDLYCKYRENRGKKDRYVKYTVIRGIRCFSVVSNLKKVLDVNAGADKLKVLHGIRFYSISWIILGHTYFHVNFAMLKSLKVTLDYLQNASFNIISNATLVVDNFFFISGLLMTYITFEVVKKTRAPPKFWQFIIHRLYRFIPMQMSFVGFTTMLPWFGSGPMWHESIDPLVDACKKDWWANLIFINNMYRSGAHGCVSHSWYLAADLQIYIVCLIALIPMLRNPRLGLLINAILMVGSIIICGCYNYMRKLPPTLLFSNPDPQQRIELMMEVYYTPYTHLAAYCIGIFVGYYLHTPWAEKILPLSAHVTGWLATAAVTSSTLFGVQVWNSGSDPGPAASAVYAAFSRSAWTLGLVWITWTCSTGQGGLMNKLLCWKALIPLSRLTFAVYLVHPYVQRVFYANIREGIEARNYMAVSIWFGFLALSYLLSVAVCVFIESPFISLGAVIFERHNAWEQKSRERKQRSKIQEMEGIDIRAEKEMNGSLVPNATSSQHKDFETRNDVTQVDGRSNNGFVCHL